MQALLEVLLDEGERVWDIIVLFIRTVAFTLIAGALIWKFFYKNEGNNGPEVVLFPIMASLAIFAFGFLANLFDRTAWAFKEAVNPGGSIIADFYGDVNEVAAQAAEEGEQSALGYAWSLITGEGGTAILAGIQKFVYDILSEINVALLDFANRLQDLMISFATAFAPVAIALSLFEMFRSKGVGFVAWTIQISLWPIGWTFGELLARLFIIEPAGPVVAINPITAVSAATALILWTLLYLILTPLVMNFLIGGGTPGSGLLGRALVTAAVISRFIPGKGQAVAPILEKAGQAVQRTGGGGGASSGSGASSSTALAPISNNARRRGGVIVPQNRQLAGPLALPAPPRERRRIPSGSPLVIDV